MVVSVITWRYDDGSASGIVGVYHGDDVDKAMTLLSCHGDTAKRFTVHRDVHVGETIIEKD